MELTSVPFRSESLAAEIVDLIRVLTGNVWEGQRLAGSAAELENGVS